MTLALLDKTRLEVVQRDQPIGNVVLPGECLLGLSIQELQERQERLPAGFPWPLLELALMRSTDTTGLSRICDWQCLSCTEKRR